MTPDNFRIARQIFLDAITIPIERRVDYVRERTESEEIRSEVLSLLEFHVDETFLRGTESPSPDTSPALDETIEFDRGPVPLRRPTDLPAERSTDLTFDQSPERSPERSSADMGHLDIELSDKISERFARSTNLLLRSRLIAATFLLSGMLVLITVVAAIAGELVLPRLIVRCVTLSLLGVCCWYIKTHIDLSRGKLRTLEILIVAAPLVELSLIVWFESTKCLVEDEASKIEELRAIAFTVVSIYIAVYGIFIPSNWRRTALITGTIALVPMVVSVLHQLTHTYPADVPWMHFINPTLAFVMVVVATVGAGIVHRVRREAESARYYGQYRLIKEIGRGGMGIVYLGKHQMLKRPAAIKLIHSEAAGSPRAIQQFEKEVQATATLSHWNTVQIYDYGTTEAGDFYCVMEYLVGETLQRRLARDNSIPVKQTFEIVLQLCDGLKEAHRKGLVHRDIKPANIFLAEIGGFTDIVKLLDFGLVVTKEETEGEQGHAVGGTPAYMSPEQIRGEALDGRSDIYAIGCVVFECLTGAAPFQPGSITQILSNQLFRMPAMDQLARIDPGLPSLIEKCLAKDREKRFADVDQLREACAKWT